MTVSLNLQLLWALRRSLSDLKRLCNSKPTTMPKDSPPCSSIIRLLWKHPPCFSTLLLHHLESNHQILELSTRTFVCFTCRWTSARRVRRNTNPGNGCRPCTSWTRRTSRSISPWARRNNGTCCKTRVSRLPSSGRPTSAREAFCIIKGGLAIVRDHCAKYVDGNATEDRNNFAKK